MKVIFVAASDYQLHLSDGADADRQSSLNRHQAVNRIANPASGINQYIRINDDSISQSPSPIQFFF